MLINAQLLPMNAVEKSKYVDNRIKYKSLLSVTTNNLNSQRRYTTNKK